MVNPGDIRLLQTPTFDHYVSAHSTPTEEVQSHTLPRHGQIFYEQRHSPGAIPDVLPPTHDYRTLVLCFDGTGDQFDGDNSNVVQLCQTLARGDKDKQMVYYQTGIGTYSTVPMVNSLFSKASKIIDEMVANTLDAHVMHGYQFLMQTYRPNDRICLFGFSRGAYTARALAGMLHKIGLLPQNNPEQIPFAYKMYTRKDEVGWAQSIAFKDAFCIDVKIEFMGVWDTVSSVGMINRRLPFTTSNTLVRTYRHALALDERRAKFQPKLWNCSREPNGQSTVPDIHVEAFIRNMKSHTPSSNWEPVEEILVHPVSAILEKKFEDSMNSTVTDVEEVWFAGCHSDVGGGSVLNDTRHSLSRISLRWMIRECFKANTGIMFRADKLRELGFDTTTLYPYVTLRPEVPKPTVTPHIQQRDPRCTFQPSRIFKKRKGPLSTNEKAPSIMSSTESNTTCSTLCDQDTTYHMSEEEEERLDALAPAYDQLDLKKYWWILEILPTVRYRFRRNNHFKIIGAHRGAGRVISEEQQKFGVKIHRSVKIRMEALDPESGYRKKYAPKASFIVQPDARFLGFNHFFRGYTLRSRESPLGPDKSAYKVRWTTTPTTTPKLSRFPLPPSTDISHTTKINNATNEMPTVQPPAKVLVTGANGYIAVWVVKALLDKGYHVRGTVRSEEKGKHLKELFGPQFGDKLEVVVVADITKPGAFDEVVKDVDAIEHTASPFHFNVDDPQELIGPAVQGTVSILKSALQYGSSVKRVVVTSSCAAVLSTPSSPTVFSEANWNEASIKLVEEQGKSAPNPEKYRASKTLAEKAAWKFVEDHKSELKWDLAVLNPPFVFGPAIHEVSSADKLNTSAFLWHQAIATPDSGGKSPEELKRSQSSYIDVRDLADAHVLAIEKEGAGGERCIISYGTFTWQDFLDISNSLSPHPLASKAGSLPKGVPGSAKDTVHPVSYDTSKMKVYGLKLRSTEETTRDTLADFEKRGW